MYIAYEIDTYLYMHPCQYLESSDMYVAPRRLVSLSKLASFRPKAISTRYTMSSTGTEKFCVFPSLATTRHDQGNHVFPRRAMDHDAVSICKSKSALELALISTSYL